MALQPLTMNLEHNNISSKISKKIRIIGKQDNDVKIATEEAARRTREKLRKKRERLRRFRENTTRRVEKSKVNNENDKIRRIEMREKDARKSLLRYAVHGPSMLIPNNDERSVAKTIQAFRRLEVSKKYSELERQRARVSSHRRDLNSKSQQEKERKLCLFRERMERHQKVHRERVEQERLRELERLSEMKRHHRDSASTRQRRKKEVQLRFVDALRIRLSEQMKRGGYGVVPLCGCSNLSEDGAIPNWTECANNCEFYNNPEKFHSAIKSMFSSIHEVERFRH